jgi:hypothetical protein
MIAFSCFHHFADALATVAPPARMDLGHDLIDRARAEAIRVNAYNASKRWPDGRPLPTYDWTHHLAGVSIAAKSAHEAANPGGGRVSANMATIDGLNAIEAASAVLMAALRAEEMEAAA